MKPKVVALISKQISNVEYPSFLHPGMDEILSLLSIGEVGLFHELPAELPSYQHISRVSMHLSIYPQPIV